MVAGVVSVSAGRAGSGSWFERRSCLDKVPFASRHGARAAARSVERRYGGRLEPYACRFCDGWHVGHQMARR